MEMLVINGSPRKDRNTAALLKYAMDGAAAAGAVSNLIHLYELDFKGCCSCFACKKKGRKFSGCCVMNDSLRDVLEKIQVCDVLLLGSPIYLGNITGLMKSFLERLIFANLSYDSKDRSQFTGCIQTGFIYTMGIPHDFINDSGYQYIFDTNKRYLELLNGKSEYLISADNYQFDDYSKYDASNFDVVHKSLIRETQFPLDCQKAYEMGERLCSL
ncbi:flavodoxin family protein [Blautia hominis]|uniref:Flavodoxin family protein n=1 Tax=Blautia hominis TaxID=2025493 RepID=A0ABQ0BA86_9FIRM